MSEYNLRDSTETIFDCKYQLNSVVTNRGADNIFQIS